MNDIETPQFDKVLEEALALSEKGVALPEILRLFPEHEKELREVFLVIGVLQKEKNTVVPSRTALTELRRRLFLPGGAHFHAEVTSKNRMWDLVMWWRMGLGVALATILLVFLVSYRSGDKGFYGKAPEFGHATISGTPGDVAAALIRDSVTAQLTAQDEVRDISLINMSSPALEGLGQTYNDSAL